MKLTLIRHSKTKLAPETPIPLWVLSDEGIQLAQNLSSKQVIGDIKVMYSSLQTKAIETALLLAKPNQIPLKMCEDLTEVSSFTLKFFGAGKYEENVDSFYSGKIDKVGEGETIDEALGRFVKAVEKIIATERSKNDNVGLVSHGNILALFTAEFSQFMARELHDKIKMPDVAVFDWDAKNFDSFWGENL